MNKHALFSISVFPLLCGVFAGGTLNQSKAILEDSIHHEIVHVLEHGLDITETGDPATLTFSNPNTTSISKNKLLAISLVSKKNLSPYSSDSYTYLQFSFMGINGSEDEKKLYFDPDDPSISERVVNNSLYYQTSDSSYEIPNRCFGETNYFFLIRNGFDGVLYIQLSDYFSSNFTFSKFKVFSDGINHWNSYELTEVYLCDDINNTNTNIIFFIYPPRLVYTVFTLIFIIISN